MINPAKIIENKKCNEENRAYGNFLLAKYELKNKNYREEFNYLVKGHKHYFQYEINKFNRGIKYWPFFSGPICLYWNRKCR